MRIMTAKRAELMYRCRLKLGRLLRRGDCASFLSFIRSQRTGQGSQAELRPARSLVTCPLILDVRLPNQVGAKPVGPPAQLVGVLGRISTAITLLDAPPKNHNLSIPRQLNFDNILRRLVHPGMFPRRIKDVALTPAGPYPNPMGLVVVPFFNLPDPTQIELTGLERLGLGSSVVGKARIAATCQAGERREEAKQEAKGSFRSCTTAQFSGPPQPILFRLGSL